MKQITITLTFFLLFITNYLTAQILGLDITDSTLNCSAQKDLYVYVLVGEDIPSANLTIDWGDGTNEVFTGISVLYSNSYQALHYTHIYANYGDYVVTSYIVQNNQIGSGATAYPLTLTYSESNSCGQIVGYCYVNGCDSIQTNYLDNAVFDLIGSDNMVTTFTGQLNGINADNFPYVLRINNTWLQDHNFIQTSPDLILTPVDVNTDMYTGNYHFFTLESASVSSEIDLNATSGWCFGVLPTETATLYFTYYDQFCSANQGVQINVTFPSFLTPDLTGLVNSSVQGNVLTYEASDFMEYLSFNLPGNTPVETILEFVVSLTDLSGSELNLTNNTMTITGLLLNSLDPNNKLVNKQYVINSNQTEELQYTINFQNEGTYNALNVVVQDTLSENLDLSTFKLLYSKHSVVTTINLDTRVATFRFDDINLAQSSVDEEASKGQIVYSIKENEGLPINSEIKNTAFIYFDFNPAIVTNTTINKNCVVGLAENSFENSVYKLYPNPASENFRIEGENIDAITILDGTGKSVLSLNDYDNEFISVAELNNGVYFVKISSNELTSVAKIVVNK